MIIYTIFLSIMLPPVGTIIGWLHMKRSLAYTEQISVGIEASPYTYKLQPGISTEVAWPNLLVNLDFVETMLDSTDNLTPERKTNIDYLRNHMHHLLKGGSIGLPDDLRLSKLKAERRENSGS